MKQINSGKSLSPALTYSFAINLINPSNAVVCSLSLIIASVFWIEFYVAKNSRWIAILVSKPCFVQNAPSISIEALGIISLTRVPPPSDLMDQRPFYVQARLSLSLFRSEMDFSRLQFDVLFCSKLDSTICQQVNRTRILFRWTGVSSWLCWHWWKSNKTFLVAPIDLLRSVSILNSTFL